MAAPPLPFLPGEVSNGEFLPRAPRSRDRLIIAETLRRAELAAHRLGMDRRRFLRSAGGMATMLGVVNLVACSEQEAVAPATTTTPPTTTTSTTTTTVAPSTTEPGGEFVVPEPEEILECQHELGDQGEFIFDIHTHHVVPGGPWVANTGNIASMILNLVPAGCFEADSYECLDRIAYVEHMFLGSDTTMGMLSDVPSSGPDDSPLPFDERRVTKDLVDGLTVNGESRVLVHDIIAPNFFEQEEHLDRVRARIGTGDVAAVKAYTAWGPDGLGYALDDPDIGLPVVELVRDLGVTVVCAHKGLPIFGFDYSFNNPRDLASLAVQYPDMDFVVFHSAFEREIFEGPYDPDNAASGVNALVKAMDDHGLPPNSNLWAELGTTWRELMSDPNQGAHVVGKLLSRVGEDRVMWGTDAIWFGSPQAQIQAFRAFQITEAFQQQYGYPALTDELKRKVLGLNAAELFDLDPEAQRCAVDESALAEHRATYRELSTSGALDLHEVRRGPMTRREVLSWLRSAPV